MELCNLTSSSYVGLKKTFFLPTGKILLCIIEWWPNFITKVVSVVHYLVYPISYLKLPFMYAQAVFQSTCAFRKKQLHGIAWRLVPLCTPKWPIEYLVKLKPKRPIECLVKLNHLLWYECNSIAAQEWENKGGIAFQLNRPSPKFLHSICSQKNETERAPKDDSDQSHNCTCRWYGVHRVPFRFLAQ